MHSLGRALRSLLTLAFWLGASLGVLKLLYVDVVRVPHNGMAPTLIYGDLVLVWRHAHVDMGDVVVCEHPARPEASVLGRAVAFGGHTVSTDGRDSLFVDDDRASIEWEGSLRFYDVTRQKLFDMRTGSIDYMRQNRHRFVVEADHPLQLTTYTVSHGAYLLGDNRADPDDDSREFGEVDPARCKGQVFMRLRPAPREDDDVRNGYLDVIQ